MYYRVLKKEIDQSKTHATIFYTGKKCYLKQVAGSKRLTSIVVNTGFFF